MRSLDHAWARLRSMNIDMPRESEAQESIELRWHEVLVAGGQCLQGSPQCLYRKVGMPLDAGILL